MVLKDQLISAASVICISLVLNELSRWKSLVTTLHFLQPVSEIVSDICGVSPWTPAEDRMRDTGAVKVCGEWLSLLSPFGKGSSSLSCQMDINKNTDQVGKIWQNIPIVYISSPLFLLKDKARCLSSPQPPVIFNSVDITFEY